MSYFTTILRNTYIEVLRKQKKSIIISRRIDVENVKIEDEKINNLLSGIEIKREISNFEKIINMYYRKWPVLLL